MDIFDDAFEPASVHRFRTTLMVHVAPTPPTAQTSPRFVAPREDWAAEGYDPLSDDLFERLGLDCPDVDVPELKHHFRVLLRREHPDCRRGRRSGQHETSVRFSLIKEAFDTLLDPAARARYLEARRADSGLVCALTDEPVLDWLAVVSPAGDVFNKDTIGPYLARFGRCPRTGVPMDSGDLVPLRRCAWDGQRWQLPRRKSLRDLASAAAVEGTPDLSRGETSDRRSDAGTWGTWLSWW